MNPADTPSAMLCEPASAAGTLLAAVQAIVAW